MDVKVLKGHGKKCSCSSYLTHLLFHSTPTEFTTTLFHISNTATTSLNHTCTPSQLIHHLINTLHHAYVPKSPTPQQPQQKSTQPRRIHPTPIRPLNPSSPPFYPPKSTNNDAKTKNKEVNLTENQNKTSTWLPQNLRKKFEKRVKGRGNVIKQSSSVFSEKEKTVGGEEGKKEEDNIGIGVNEVEQNVKEKEPISRLSRLFVGILEGKWGGDIVGHLQLLFRLLALDVRGDIEENILFSHPAEAVYFACLVIRSLPFVFGIIGEKNVKLLQENQVLRYFAPEFISSLDARLKKEKRRKSDRFSSSFHLDEGVKTSFSFLLFFPREIQSYEAQIT